MTPRSPLSSGAAFASDAGDEPDQVEGADQIDVDDLREVGERLRAVAPDDALGDADAGAIDEDARRAMRGLGRGDSGLGRGRVRDVAGEGDAAEGARGRPRPPLC